MTLQNIRFRCIVHFSKKDLTVEQFQRAVLDWCKAWDALPVVQRNLIHRDVCFSMSDSSTVVQGLSIPGRAGSSDATVILGLESLEKYEEMNRDPEGVKLIGSFASRGFEMKEVILSKEITTTTQGK
ncbi:hypothetical protein FB451DRAFT_1374751 [Mycena latifolia]|nr:hypothetical protein FB451DRAFT_1374751 [Mycena latifolia]